MGDTAEGGLGRLIETEARIAATLAAARAEADAIVRAARNEAEAEEQRFQEQLQRDLVTLAAGITATRDAELARVAAAAQAQRQRLEGISDAAVHELADWVTRRLESDPGRQA
jgi:hypothetical protein